MTLAHKLVGSAMQMAVCQLAEGQTVYCEAGRFRWKTTNVTAESRPAQPGAGIVGRAVDAGRRALTGETLNLQYFRAHDGAGLLCVAGSLPGEMRALELHDGQGWYAEKAAFVAAESSVHVDSAYPRLRVGGTGAAALALHKFTGLGTLLVAGAGTFIEVNPATYGGMIDVDAGCLVAFADTVHCAGANVATLSGDGQVILASTTIEGLAKALATHIVVGKDNKGPLGGLLSKK